MRSGFSTSRTLGSPRDGRPAGAGHVRSRGRAVRARARHATRRRRAVFELAPLGASGEDLLAPEQEMEWMRRLSDELDLPVSFTLLQIDAAPDVWRGLMDESLRAHDAGAQVVPQVAARPFGMLLGFPTRHGFSGRPTYRELAARLSPDELLAELAKPGGAGADPGRGRRRARPDGAVRRHVPAGAGLARPPLRARRPAGLRADPRPHDRGDGGGGRRRAARRCCTTSCSSTARSTCSCCRSSTTPSATTTPSARCCCTRRRVGTVRRRRALRAHLRRVDPDVHAHALGARPHARRHAAARVPGEEADVRHRRALRARRPRRRSRRARRPTST